MKSRDFYNCLKNVIHFREDFFYRGEFELHFLIPIIFLCLRRAKAQQARPYKRFLRRIRAEFLFRECSRARFCPNPLP